MDETGCARKTVSSGLILLACLCCHASVLHAASVGGAAKTAEKGQWVLGLDGSTLLQRGLSGGSGASKVSVFQGSHVRGVGLTDWLAIFGRIGAGILTTTVDSVDHDLGGGLLLGGEVRARLWQNARKNVSWDSSVQYTDIRSRHSGKNGGAWREWQFATGVNTVWGKQKPYAGIRLSFADLDYTLRQNGGIAKAGTASADGVVGGYVGTAFYVDQSNTLLMNIEAAYTGGAELDIGLTAKY